jgi:uncharacterized membrane protein YedE/YeeE
MSSFTPVASALGGALIGLSATLLLMLNGRVAGVSGILGGVVRPTRGDWGWKVLFLLGLLSAGVLVARLHPGAFGAPSVPIGVLIVGGVLVGAGTELGNGCTSGHGVCGISRGSTRSIAATVVFMVIAAMTVYVVHHVLGAPA